MANTYKTIEQGSRGATYQNGADTFTVYEIGTYPRHSVLAGQESRRFIDSYDSLEAAKAAHPTAEPIDGSTYREPALSHLPDDGYDDTAWPDDPNDGW